jgi:uncharacterized protein YodC (DUF2158 family)
MNEIKAGDIVQLRSGSPDMTVNFVEKEEAACSWFEGKKLEHSRFMVTSLKKVG